LGYETYQKILNEAVKELKNDEFSDLYADEIAQGNDINGDEFVDECILESDMQMYFGEQYVPGSSERMLLYRELDGLEREEDVQNFRKRMEDRFGPIPPEGEELIRVVLLRKLGCYFGSERIILKAGRMRLFFVQNANSAFYQSKPFGQVISFATTNVHRCRLDEVKGHRSMLIQDVHSVKEAVEILEQMKKVEAV